MKKNFAALFCAYQITTIKKYIVDYIPLVKMYKIFGNRNIFWEIINLNYLKIDLFKNPKHLPNPFDRG